MFYKIYNFFLGKLNVNIVIYVNIVNLTFTTKILRGYFIGTTIYFYLKQKPYAQNTHVGL